MTNQDVINFLNQVRKMLLDDRSWLESTIQPINEAFNRAISALQAQEVNASWEYAYKVSLSMDNEKAQKPEPCEDVVSRQTAIEAVEHITSSMSVCVNTDECHGMKRMQRQAVIELVNLPSAQPERKKGKWIDICGNLRCSECNIEYPDLYPDYDETNFCPNCGAEMSI